MKNQRRKGSEIYKSQKYWGGLETTGTATAKYKSTKPDLQLLVIDLGDSCVVKVEKGNDANVFVHWGESESGTPLCLRTGETVLLKIVQFTDLKSAIDAMDTPPVPRIERSSPGSHSAYLLSLGGDRPPYALLQSEYDALSQLAGHPLPIYEKGGTWTLLKGSTVVGDGSGVKLWRYTK